MTAPEHVINAAVRAAVLAMAEGTVADGGPVPGGSLEVLRHCLCGSLLLDITGSDLRLSEDGSTLGAGSTIRIATTSDPDGGTALVAFTSQAEIARTRAATAQTQSMVQAGVAVLDLVRSQGHGWLYVDPAGPSCAISRAEIDVTLDTPRNDAVREAIEAAGADPSRRGSLLAALAAEGVLLLATEADGAAPRTEQVAGVGRALAAFTSAPELLVRMPGARIRVLPTAHLRALLGELGLPGLVINPAGPSAAVTAVELGG